jgi:rRNA biogenesis protein RRP5
MTFEAKVSEKSVKQGIKLDFGDLTGYVHHHHLNKDISEYEAEETVSAHVLYISPTINTVYFSLRDHTKLGAKFSDPFSTHKIGDIVPNVEVVDTSSKGLTIKIDENSLGFVPAKSISDSKVSYKDFKKEYLKGTVKANCRIFQYDFIDQHFICSLQKSMLKANQSIVLAENLKPGDKVSCTIKNFVKQGVIVDMGMKHVEAFIPFLHLTDVPMTHPEKKFSTGDKLNCKVLRVDPSKRKIHLTSKPILVKKNDYEIVSTYDESNVGKVTEGVVVKLSGQGLLLQLFGDVRGWVPKSKISSEAVEHPEKLFFLGQSLKCQVVNTEAENERMTLTLILGDGKFKPLGKKEKTASEHLRLGRLYTCKVDSIASDGLNVLTVHVKDEDEVTIFERLVEFMALF